MRIAFFLGAAVALLAPAAPLSAGQVGVELVRDVDTGPASWGVSSSPQRFRSIDGKVYFAATTPATGTELFVSDGNSAAQLVADIARGPASSAPTALGMAGGRLIVAADDGLRGELFWAVDPASATATRLSTVAMSNSGNVPMALGMAGGRLVFSDRDGWLWSSDGSPAGTQRLNRYGAVAGQSCSTGGRVVALLSGSFESVLVGTDGTPANTVVLAEFDRVEGGHLVSDGGQCYVALRNTSPWQIWRSDGTAAGTAQWRAADRNAWLCGAARMGSRVFVAEQSAEAFRVVDADTRAPLLTVPQGTCYSASNLMATADRLVWTGPEPQPSQPNGRALYLSDGSAAGTQRVALPEQIYSGAPLRLEPVGAHVLLTASYAGYSVNPANGSIEPFANNLTGLYSGDHAVVGGTLLIAGNDLIHGNELWRSDGTAAGTTQLHDIWASNGDGVGHTDPTLPAAAIGDAFYFLRFARDGEMYRKELWRSDGSEAGTVGLAPALYANEFIEDMVTLGDGLAFSTGLYNGTNSRMSVYRVNAALSAVERVWTDSTAPSVLQGIPGGGLLFDCDGSSSGNLCALAPGQSQVGIIATAHTGLVDRLGQVGPVAFFAATYSAAGVNGIWRSDGTAPGTFRVGPGLALPSFGTNGARRSLVHNGRLWLIGCEGDDSQCALYTSDGSNSGMQRLAALPSSVRDMAALGSGIAVLLGGQSSQLFYSDGTSAGTVPLASLPGVSAPGMTSSGGYLHFVLADWNEVTYYVSDGTPAGTRAVTLPPAFKPGPAPLVALDADTVVLHCSSPSTGDELCVADATGTRVSLLRDIFPGPTSSSAQLLGKAGAAAYFSADDGTRGRELWRAHVLGDAIFRNGFE